jgi:hypothetical protein
MTKTWFEPTTIMLGMSAAAMAAQGFSSIMQGNFAASQAGAQAQMYRDATDAVRSQETNAHKDLQIQRDRAMASAKATLAAQGGGEDEGLLSAEASQFGAADARITNDSLVKQRSLLYRANYVEAAGGNERQNGLFTGIGKFVGAAGQGYAAYKSLK